jgi:hypothetical protein
MKGIVFNLLEQVVVRHHGDTVWEELLENSDLPGTYTSLGSYPDEEIMRLVGTASEMLRIPPADVLRWFGRNAMPLLSERFPIFFTPHRNTLSFLKSVNDIIHPEVRKLYAGAGCPHFAFRDMPDGALNIGYNSARKLCALAHGFIEGAADHFHEHADVEHVTCMNKGDARCEINVRTFSKSGMKPATDSGSDGAAAA